MYRTYDDYLEDGEVLSAVCKECEYEFYHDVDVCTECGHRRFYRFTREDIVESLYEKGDE